MESISRLSIDDSVLKPVSKSMESISRLSIDDSVLKSVSKSMESISRLSIDDSVLKSVSKSMESISELSKDISKFRFSTEAIGLYNDELSQVDDINLDINDINDVFLDDSLTIQEKLYNIWEKVKSKNIIVVLLVYNFIILPIFNPIKEAYDDLVYESLCNAVQSITVNVSNKDGKQLNKSIKNDTIKELNNDSCTNKEDILNTYRFVSCDNLNVRSKNTINSAVIYCLNKGDVVKIINKQKNWTKIEYKNNDETISVTGWVFTRYISKFK